MEPGLGSLIGGGIAGLGETLAEGIEGTPINPKRVLLEAGLGAVPLGKIFTGRPLQSALRSAALAGVGETGRELTTGEDLSPGRIATTTGLGALLGGVLGRFPAERPKVPVVEQAPETAVSRLVSPLGQTVKSLALPIEREPGLVGGAAPKTADISSLIAEPAEKRIGAITKRLNRQDIAQMVEAERKRALLEKEQATLGGAQDVLTAEGRRLAAIRAGREGLEAEPSFGRTISAKTPEGVTERMSIRYAEEKAGGAPSAPREPGITPAPIESIPPSIPERFAKKAPEVGIVPPAIEEAVSRITDPMAPRLRTRTGELITPRVPTPTPAVEPPTPTPTPEVIPSKLTPDLKKLLKGAGLDKAGIATLEKDLANPATAKETNQAIKQFLGVETPTPAPTPTPAEIPLAEATPIARAAQQSELRSFMEGKGKRPEWGGKVEPTPEPTERPSEWDMYPAEVAAELDRLGPAYRKAQGAEKRAIGARMSQIRREAQFAPGGPRTLPKPEPLVPKEPEAPLPPEGDVPDWAKRERAKAEELASLSKRAKGEAGFVDPALLARGGLAGLGALAGGVAGGAVGHPFLGMAAGAVGGALTPNIVGKVLSGMGAPPDAVQAGMETLMSHSAGTPGAPAPDPAKIQDTAKKIFAAIPQAMRFNYLADVTGLPANAWFGPYGSAMMAGIEHMLAGDPRGVALLSKLSPVRFLQEYKKSFQEAGELIAAGEAGRAETSIVPGGGITAKVLELPGQTMTAGDVAARRILQEAGFTEDEARTITLTSEPEALTFRRLANLSKGSPLLQILQPFARTPANIAEQGFRRTPLIGFINQMYRETPDPLRQQIAQQGLGLAEMLGAGAVGSQVDPETSRGLRTYLTNLGGQYSLPANIGFAVGQAIRSGKPLGPAAVGAAAGQGLPLPTIGPALEWGKFLTEGGTPPGGMIPRDLRELLFPSQQLAVPPRLRR